MVPREQAAPARADPRSLADVTRSVLRLASARGGDGRGHRPRVLVLSDGTSVLSRGALGVEAVRPILERKCAVIERATAMSAFPLALAPAGSGEHVRALELLRSNYDAILMVDIAAPRCFELRRLLDGGPVDCPVLHDDEEGTAAMAAAVVLTAVARTGRKLGELCVVVVGAGAAGTGTARLLHDLGAGELRVVDSAGIVRPGRAGLTGEKTELAALAGPYGPAGSVRDALRGADVCVGLSGAPIGAADLAGMNAGPVIIPLSYPDVEVGAEDAAALDAVYLPALEHDLSNNLATPGLLLAACELGLRRLSVPDMRAAANRLVSLAEDRPDAPPLPRADPVPLARSIADAVAEGRGRDTMTRWSEGEHER
ncbi:malic enzyme-like NAD(P)-binding protein [Actinocorallia longicatena]|uniref:NADP-dependent malic enzyme n=1 Tax=Actinocorallia longicatena TaxID=111803 RepID=A0ABP6QEZ4_9ACTN